MNDPSVIAISIGGAEYEKPHDRSCPVCMSPLLLTVDTLLSYGWTYERIRGYMRSHNAIAASAAELQAHVAHLAAPHAEARRQLEEAVAGRGQSMADGSVPVNPADLAQLALNRAYQGIQSGTEVSVRDAAGILKLAREIARDQADTAAAASAAQWEAALRELLWIARRHLGPSWRAFMNDLRGSETLLAIMPPDTDGGEAGARPADRAV